MRRCGCVECSEVVLLWYTLYCTSGGTLNFSTTPSSKKQRIPHLMSSNSDKGKSLKRNSRSSTFLASGMLVLWEFETHRKQSAYHPKQPEFMRSTVVNVSQCLPTVCTSPSAHSPPERSRTSLECSEWGNNIVFFIGFPSGWTSQSTEAAAYQNGLHVSQCGRRLVHEHFLGDFFTPLCPVQFVVCVAAQGGPAEELG